MAQCESTLVTIKFKFTLNLILVVNNKKCLYTIGKGVKRIRINLWELDKHFKLKNWFFN